jgi:hypothetical protein
VSYQTHTVAEWLAMVSLASSGYAAFSAVYFLLVDADASDFDPRPAVRHALEAGPLVPVWQVVVDAGHTANRGIALAELHALQVRDRARLAAVALLLVAATHLSSSAPKKGATHV